MYIDAGNIRLSLSIILLCTEDSLPQSQKPTIYSKPKPDE